MNYFKKFLCFSHFESNPRRCNGQWHSTVNMLFCVCGSLCSFFLSVTLCIWFRKHACISAYWYLFHLAYPEGLPVCLRLSQCCKINICCGREAMGVRMLECVIPDRGVGVLVPFLFILDAFSSSAPFLVHLFFSLPALPPKQFTYFPDIRGASVCDWMLMLQLMDEIVQERGQKLDERRSQTSPALQILIYSHSVCSFSPFKKKEHASNRVILGSVLLAHT